MNRLFSSILKRLSAACLLCVCALVPAAYAQSDGAAIKPVWYASTIDPDAGLARFSVRFDRMPDLLSVDDAFRPADSFQFWTDTTSSNPIESVYAGLQGSGPLGTQSVLTSVDIPASGTMTYIWPRDASYTGPRDSGGWGSIEGHGAYTLEADGTVSFDVPLSLLHAADGFFYYAFETFRYGAIGSIDYFGIGGQEYSVSCVPEPSEALLLLAGLVVMPAMLRRGRRTRRFVAARP
jgi:hypothetical protein